jgi:hypothetical protein
MSFCVRTVVTVVILVAFAACGPKTRGFPGDDMDGGVRDDASATADDAALLDGGSSSSTSCDIAKQHKSSIGCDYYSLVPSSFNDPTAGSCFAAYIANTSTNEATIEVSYKGKKLDPGLARIPKGTGANITYAPLPNGKLPAGQMAILFLMNYGDSSLYGWVSCPAGVTAGVTTESTTSKSTAMLDAFHITTSEPVVAYDIFPYGGASAHYTSATLLIPTSAWDTSYVAADAHASLNDGYAHDPFIQITAAQPGTQVTINPRAAIIGGGGVAPAAQGMPHTYTLAAGEVLQLKQPAELGGSVIQSNNPIGLWGGHSQMIIGNDAADTAHQQLFPVRALGSEYAAVKHKNRTSFDEQPPWRIVGVVDGTILTYSPPVAGPAMINKGQVVDFTASGPFVVTSQDEKHPFYISAYMTGQDSQNQSFKTGDPEWVNIVPPAQYMDRYIFFTDPTFGNTNLVVVRRKAKDGTFKEVSLDCLNASLSGWQPIAADYEYTRVDIATGNGMGVNGCDNGLHEMHSAEPFGLTVWGWDSFVSYAYPAGAKIEFINDVQPPIN